MAGDPRKSRTFRGRWLVLFILAWPVVIFLVWLLFTRVLVVSP